MMKHELYLYCKNEGISKEYLFAEVLAHKRLLKKEKRRAKKKRCGLEWKSDMRLEEQSES